MMKMAYQIIQGKVVYSINGIETCSHVDENKIRSISFSLYQNKFQMCQKLNSKKIMKVLQVNIREFLKSSQHGAQLRMYDRHKAQKPEKINLTQEVQEVPFKNTRQAWEIFAKHLIDRGLIFLVY